MSVSFPCLLAAVWAWHVDSGIVSVCSGFRRVIFSLSPLFCPSVSRDAEHSCTGTISTAKSKMLIVCKLVWFYYSFIIMAQNKSSLALSGFCSFKENSTASEDSLWSVHLLTTGCGKKCRLSACKTSVWVCVRVYWDWLFHRVKLIVFEPLLGWVEPNVLFSCEHKDKTHIDPWSYLCVNYQRDARRKTQRTGLCSLVALPNFALGGQ